MDIGNIKGAASPRSGCGFVAGTLIGVLGGLIGLGGAEFRLSVLVGVFQLEILKAVILIKAMSLVVVASAVLFRARTIPAEQLLPHLPVVLNLLAGSLSLLVSLPAMIVGFARYRRSDAFAVLQHERSLASPGKTKP